MTLDDLPLSPVVAQASSDGWLVDGTLVSTTTWPEQLMADINDHVDHHQIWTGDLPREELPWLLERCAALGLTMHATADGDRSLRYRFLVTDGRIAQDVIVSPTKADTIAAAATTLARLDTELIAETGSGLKDVTVGFAMADTISSRIDLVRIVDVLSYVCEEAMAYGEPLSAVPTSEYIELAAALLIDTDQRQGTGLIVTPDWLVRLGLNSPGVLETAKALASEVVVPDSRVLERLTQAARVLDEQGSERGVPRAHQSTVQSFLGKLGVPVRA